MELDRRKLFCTSHENSLNIEVAFTKTRISECEKQNLGMYG